MKNIIKNFFKITIYVLVCILFFSYPIFSEDIEDLIVKYAGKLTINNSEFKSDTYLINNHLYVPILDLAEKLDAEVTFNPITNSICYNSVTDFAQSDPLAGEEFVYGEIESINFEEKTIMVKQHYDDNSYDVTSSLSIIDDAIIILQRNSKRINISYKDLRIGDIVGMILNENKDIRGIIVDL